LNRSRAANRWAATPSSASLPSSASSPADATSPSPKATRVVEIEDDIFAVLRRALSGHKARASARPAPFTAGAVGFLSYDAVRQIERLPSLAKDELGVPDACLLFFDEVLAFDHVRKEIWLVVTADVTRGKAAANPAHAYDKAIKRLDALEKRLAQPLPKSLEKKGPSHGKLKVNHRTSKKNFLAAVDRTKEYIAAGDIFQAVLSQRFDVTPEADTFQVYRALRTVNPSPYMYFLRFSPDGPLGGMPDKSKSSSKKSKAARRRHRAGRVIPRTPRPRPQGKVEYRPIAGTRPRGATEKEDQALADEMLADEKERAEHVMLSRSRPQRRRPRQRVRLRQGRPPHVRRALLPRHAHRQHHRRPLKPELTAVDALRACFPAGTLSGAPKVRAMEIIEELEPSPPRHLRRRSPLRRLLRQPRLLHRHPLHARHWRQGHVQAGAGIVADSVPELEYQESLNKAQAVIRAIERAREASTPQPSKTEIHIAASLQQETQSRTPESPAQSPIVPSDDIHAHIDQLNQSHKRHQIAKCASGPEYQKRHQQDLLSPGCAKPGIPHKYVLLH
jgi:anthranilate synthase component 1